MNDIKTCSVIDYRGIICGEVIAARGLCWGHYRRLMRGGQVGDRPLRRYEREKSTCLTEGCTNISLYRGLCRGCYSRLLISGTTQKRERLTKCLFDGCIKSPQRSGYCWNHYNLVKGRVKSNRVFS
jgi:hypothetical protein